MKPGTEVLTIQDLHREWMTEHKEWCAIRNELTVTGTPPDGAAVDAEQSKRMVARGDVPSVLSDFGKTFFGGSVSVGDAQRLEFGHKLAAAMRLRK